MNVKPLQIAFAALSVVVAVAGKDAHAAPPRPALAGTISGIELAPQSIAGSAIFLFNYSGTVNGRPRNGWGWMAVQHEPLSFASLILGGEGEIYIGWQRYRVNVNGGVLVLIDINDPAVFDDDFGVLLFADICDRRRRCVAHRFEGILTHAIFPPGIFGVLQPD